MLFKTEKEGAKKPYTQNCSCKKVENMTKILHETNTCKLYPETHRISHAKPSNNQKAARWMKKDTNFDKAFRYLSQVVHSK